MNPKLTETSTVIKLQEWWGGAPDLICPRCGSLYLHHGKVTVFDRGEDDDTTAVTIVKDGLSATHILASDRIGNPSSRRHGVVIAFDCEECGPDGTIELTIAQHKGNTQLEWRFARKESSEDTDAGRRLDKIIPLSKAKEGPAA